MPLVILLVAIWLFAFDGTRDLTNWLYPEDAAPWETVDLFYYPDQNDLTKHYSVTGLKTVSDCRNSVYWTSYRYSTPPKIGTYECGVGDTGERLGSIKIYRVTVK